jgi:hypothetical protein
MQSSIQQLSEDYDEISKLCKRLPNIFLTTGAPNLPTN